MKSYTRICARIHLDAIEQNIEHLRGNLAEGVKMMVVVKADAYGHGAIQTTSLLSLKEYVWGFAVATLDEAIVLKRSGITKPILVLGCVFPEQRADAIENNIRMTVYEEDMAKEISDLAAALKRKAYIHIKIDTGMGRIGFPVNVQNAAQIEKICGLPGIIPEGMYTHFSKADEADKAYTEKQMGGFLWMKEELKRRQTVFSYYHCSNSAGIIEEKGTDQNLVRAGISTYGMYPSEEVCIDQVCLFQDLELICLVAHL